MDDGGLRLRAVRDEAEPLDGPTYEAMAKAASDAGVWLHAGSIPRAGRRAGTLYNTSLVFSPAGELAATYRKIHRFGFDKGEAVLMGAGAELVTVALPETTVGLATCYDLRFPELFRGLVDAGAETIVVSAGWPERRRAHWTLLAQARAVENQAFVLACGTAGTHAGVPQAGHSIVVDPWGEVLAEAGAGEEVLRRGVRSREGGGDAGAVPGAEGPGAGGGGAAPGLSGPGFRPRRPYPSLGAAPPDPRSALNGPRPQTPDGLECRPG